MPLSSTDKALIVSLVEGSLEPDQVDEVQTRIEGDQEFAREVREQVVMGGLSRVLLTDVRDQSKATNAAVREVMRVANKRVSESRRLTARLVSARLRQRRQQNQRRTVIMFSSLAAAAAVVCAIIIIQVVNARNQPTPSPQPVPEPVVAQAMAVDSQGKEWFAGETLTVPKDASKSQLLRLTHDVGTELTLFPGAMLTFQRQTNDQVVIDVQAGGLWCAAAPQSVDAPLLFQLGRWSYTVVGTQFEIARRAETVALSVSEGVVNAQYVGRTPESVEAGNNHYGNDSGGSWIRPINDFILDDFDFQAEAVHWRLHTNDHSAITMRRVQDPSRPGHYVEVEAELMPHAGERIVARLDALPAKGETFAGSSARGLIFDVYTDHGGRINVEFHVSKDGVKDDFQTDIDYTVGEGWVEVQLDWHEVMVKNERDRMGTLNQSHIRQISFECWPAEAKAEQSYSFAVDNIRWLP